MKNTGTTIYTLPAHCGAAYLRHPGITATHRLLVQELYTDSIATAEGDDEWPQNLYTIRHDHDHTSALNEFHCVHLLSDVSSTGATLACAILLWLMGCMPAFSSFFSKH